MFIKIFVVVLWAEQKMAEGFFNGKMTPLRARIDIFVVLECKCKKAL